MKEKMRFEVWEIKLKTVQRNRANAAYDCAELLEDLLKAGGGFAVDESLVQIGNRFIERYKSHTLDEQVLLHETTFE